MSLSSQPESYDLRREFFEHVQELVTATNSAGVSIYWNDPKSDNIEAKQSAPDLIDKFESTDENCDICYISAKKSTLLIDSAESYHSKMDSVVCFPVLNSRKECLCKVELYRTNSEAYPKSFLNYANHLSTWLGVYLEQKEVSIREQIGFKVTKQLTEMLFEFFEKRITYGEYLSKVMEYSKNFCQAEKCYLYETYLLKKRFKSDFYIECDAGKGFEMVKTKALLRFKEGTYTNQILNTRTTVRTNQSDTTLTFSKETQKNFPTESIKSMLLVPLLCGNSFYGVMKFFNKTDNDNTEGFTAKDQFYLEKIAKLFAIGVHYKKAFNLYELRTMRCKVMQFTLKHLLKPSSANFPMKIKLVKSMPKESDNLAWCQQVDSPGEQQMYMYSMFKEICGDFLIDESVIKFIMSASMLYRDQPYHNFKLAFLVVHTLYCILCVIAEHLDIHEKAALMITAVLFYCDHNGLDNEFMQKINHPMTKIYKLFYKENQRDWLAHLLIDHSGILKHLAPDDVKKIMYIIQERLRKMRNYDLTIFRDRVNKLLDDEEFDLTLAKHRTHILSLIFRCAIHARHVQSFAMAKQLCENLYQEYYVMGDRGKTIGVMPIDRKNRDKIKQVPFFEMNYIRDSVLPCFKILERVFPKTGPMNSTCLQILNAYQILIELEGKKLWNPDKAIGKSFTDEFSS